jgi:hypothetical protein
MVHKYYVFLACLQLNAPFYLAIFHDNSKFNLQEFMYYAQYFFDKNGNPNNIKRIYGENVIGNLPEKFEKIWLNHQKINKHHYNYWIIFENNEIKPIPIPDKYIKEMIADWIGVSKTSLINKDVLKWYLENKNSIILHPDTRIKIEKILNNLYGI